MGRKQLIVFRDVEICQQDRTVLKNVNIEINSGEFIYLLGKVGSGKTSLMKSFYSELPVTNGSAHIFDYDLTTIKENEIPFLRRKIGIVFQDFQLLTDRSVYENLKFVLLATGWKDTALIDEQINSVLKQVDMSKSYNKLPHQLSGGEQQRVVIARALLNSPEIIIADEPTGNLDTDTGRDIVELLNNIRKSGTTIIMATHNLSWVDIFPGRIFGFDEMQIFEIQHPSLAKIQVNEEKQTVSETVNQNNEPIQPEN